jgi:hypothetical protein
MAKKKKPTDKPEKVVIYLEVLPALKERLRRLGALPHRNRKVTAEATVALYEYLAREEKKEGLPPLEGEG